MNGNALINIEEELKKINKGLRGLIYVQAMGLPISQFEIKAQLKTGEQFNELEFRIARANSIVEKCFKS